MGILMEILYLIMKPNFHYSLDPPEGLDVGCDSHVQGNSKA
jgi:hypothetical protein